MKRVFIVKNAPLGAPQPLSVDITGLLKNFKLDKDLEVNLIISKSSKIPEEIKKLCRKIYQIESSTYSIKDNLKFSHESYSILRKENKKSKIDVIHSIYPNSSLLAAVAFKKFVNRDVRIIYEVRSPWIEMSISQGYIGPTKVFAYRFLLFSEEKWLCKHVDHFIFISEGLSDYYDLNFNTKNKQRTIIPSGVDNKIFRRVKSDIRKKYKVKLNEILMGYVGSIERKRELQDFVKLFSQLSKKRPRIKLMFVGDGNSREELKNLSNELNISDKIIFTGKIPHKDIPKYISAFDFGVCHLPDIFVYENSFPLKILEYLSCGVPVLASDMQAHRDIARKLDGVYIYNGAREIAEILSKKSSDRPNLLRDYYWINLVKKYFKIYKEIEK